MGVVVQKLAQQDLTVARPVRVPQEPVPALVTLVHDDPFFLWQAFRALSEAGHEVDVFDDPVAALNEIDAASVEIFIARVMFLSGKPNGVSLARVLLTKYPRMKVIFADEPEREEPTIGVGEFLSHPLDPAKLVEIVNRIVSETSNKIDGDNAARGRRVATRLTPPRPHRE